MSRTIPITIAMRFDITLPNDELLGRATRINDGLRAVLSVDFSGDEHHLADALTAMEDLLMLCRRMRATAEPGS